MPSSGVDISEKIASRGRVIFSVKIGANVTPGGKEIPGIWRREEQGASLWLGGAAGDLHRLLTDGRRSISGRVVRIQLF